MPQLSPQFDPKKYAAKLADPDVGGYSVDPYTGQEPTSGTMMARYGGTELEGLASPQQVEEHASRVSPGQFAGGWFSEGTTYLDESRNFPSGAAAMDFGRKNAQIAGFNLNKFKDVPVRYGPPPTRKDTLLGELPVEDVRSMDKQDQEILRKRQETHLQQQQEVRESPSLQKQHRTLGERRRAERARVKDQLQL